VNDPRFPLPDLGATTDGLAVGAPLPHDSAALHVSGDAAYTDDLPEPRGTLHAAVGASPIAHGRLRAVRLDAVRAMPGVVDAIVASDLPGVPDVGPIQHDDPILADGVVQFAGQPVFAVAATSVEAARRAALAGELDIEPLVPVLTI
jgi:xanthine dehydrogenase large subunit